MGLFLHNNLIIAECDNIMEVFGFRQNNMVIDMGFRGPFFVG